MPSFPSCSSLSRNWPCVPVKDCPEKGSWPLVLAGAETRCGKPLRSWPPADNWKFVLDRASFLRVGFRGLRRAAAGGLWRSALVAPSLTSSVCCDCGPAELTVLEGHTATLGRALVEENFLLVWRSSPYSILKWQSLPQPHGGKTACGHLRSHPRERECRGTAPHPPRRLQNFFTAHVGLLQGLRSRNSTQTRSSPATALKSCAIFWMHPHREEE